VAKCTEDAGGGDYTRGFAAAQQVVTSVSFCDFDFDFWVLGFPVALDSAEKRTSHLRKSAH
jgi:hypothetical protein